jgi:hypothetical protein
VAAVRLLLAAAGLLSLIGGGAPAAPGVQLLYANRSGPIDSFAQDGGLLAWFAPGTHRCNQVRVVSLDATQEALPKQSSTNVTCRWDLAGSTPRLAVAAATGATVWTLHEHGSADFDYVVGAGVRQPIERRFVQITHSRAGAGLWLGGVAGAGRTLVYSMANVAYVNEVDCLGGGGCRERIHGGGIQRVVGRKENRVPHTGPALEVAAAAGRIAYVPAVGVGPGGRPTPSSLRAIPVRTAGLGTLVTRVAPHGMPLAIALAPHVLAVMTRSGPRTRISWYDPQHGDERAVFLRGRG